MWYPVYEPLCPFSKNLCTVIVGITDRFANGWREMKLSFYPFGAPFGTLSIILVALLFIFQT